MSLKKVNKDKIENFELYIDNKNYWVYYINNFSQIEND